MVLVSFLVSLLVASAAVRPRRDFAGMERRRKQAAKLFANGKSQADVARELGVSRQSVSRWYSDWRSGGITALSGAGRAGRLPELCDDDLRRLERELLRGPAAHGYPTDMWTLERVREVIESTTGVDYHPGHVWKVLRRMGWSRQRPARRAIERDSARIARWVKEDWPRIKKTPGAGAH